VLAIWVVYANLATPKFNDVLMVFSPPQLMNMLKPQFQLPRTINLNLKV